MSRYRDAVRKTTFIVAVSLLLACGCEPDIDPADYDRSCSVATDCVVIFTGPVCDCACDNAAINNAGKELLAKQVRGRLLSHPPTLPTLPPR